MRGRPRRTRLKPDILLAVPGRRGESVEFDSIDALPLERLPELRRRNPRAEVPVLPDDDLVIIDSECIINQLEDVRPAPIIFPKSPRDRARTREWQRFADRTIDAIVHDMSL